MNWRLFDLNLLIVFDAVARERSVVRAAARLNMSSSALSHALGRLRKVLDDELFTRAPTGMELTPRAVALHDTVRSTIELLEDALSPAFDPSTSRHAYKVALDNRSALTLAAPLAQLVARDGPNMTLDLVPSGTLDLTDRLEKGDLDAIVTCIDIINARMESMPLFEDDHLVLLRTGHPAASGSTITLSHLALYPHLDLSSTGEANDFVDAALAANNLSRRIELRAPLVSAAAVLQNTDMVTVTGRKIAQQTTGGTRLATLELPFSTPRSKTSLVWHKRWNGSAAHRWLREAVCSIAGRACISPVSDRA